MVGPFVDVGIPASGAGNRWFPTGTATDVVGITVAEFIPRQVMHVQQMLAGFPLLHR